MSLAHRLIIATPTRGNPHFAEVSWGYASGIRKLEAKLGAPIRQVASFAQDVYRSRSRIASMALEADGWDWILWWDDDVVPGDVSIVERMVDVAERKGFDVLGAPDPRKRTPAQFPYRPTQEHLRVGRLDGVDGCVEVEALCFGFLLTHRHCIQKLCEAHRDLWFTDTHDPNRWREPIAIFDRVYTETREIDGKRYREMLSEDYSFCHRWRALGGKVMMYLGEGSPVAHVGGYKFTGTAEEIGSV